MENPGAVKRLVLFPLIIITFPPEPGTLVLGWCPQETLIRLQLQSILRVDR